MFNGKELRKLRKEKRISAEYLASQIGCHRTTIVRYEAGDVVPTPHVIRQMARVLDVSPLSFSDVKLIKIGTPFAQTWDTYAKGEEAHRKEKEKWILGIEKAYDDIDRISQVLSGLMRSIPVFLYMKDAELQYVAASDSYLKHFNTDKGKIFRKKDIDIMTRREARKNEDLDMSVLDRGEKIINMEMPIPGTQGKRTGLFTKTPLFDKNDEIIGILCTISDITDLRHAEEENKIIREHADRSSECIFAARYKGIGSTDIEFIYINKAIEAMTGIPYGKVSTKTEVLLNVIHRDYRNDVYKAFLKNKYPFTKEFPIIRPDDKTTKWVNLRVQNDGDNIFSGNLRDITDERKQQDIQALLYKVINSMPNIVWIATVDPEFKYYYLSDAIEEFSGIPQQDFLENPKLWSSLRHPDDSGAFLDWNQRKECPAYYTYRIIRPDGNVRKIEEIFFRGSDFEGREIYYGILRDVTK